MTPDQYCQDKASRSGSSFYYSFLFLPEAERRAITALYAFCREVDDIVDDNTDPQIAKIKLQWWRDTMRQTFAGEPQHPVQKALLSPIKRYGLALSHFHDIIDGMEMDLLQNRYSSFSDLTLYCHRVAGVVGLLAARIFNGNPSEPHDDVNAGDRLTQGVQDYAENLGLAFQLTNIIRDIREDAARGRIYLPLEDLQRFNVSERELLQSASADPATQSANLRELIQFQVARAENYYQAAFACLPEQERYTQRCGLIMASLYHAVLNKIADNVDRVLAQRVSLSPWTKLWLAWRAARHEKRRYKKHVQTCNI